MSTQPVIIDREATDAAKLSPNSATGTTPPPAFNTGKVMVAIAMGNGLVKYRTNLSSASSASGTITQLVIAKPHRFVRLELQLLTSSISGTSDNFTGQVSFGTQIPNNAAAAAAALAYLFFSTNGTPSATNNIVFVGGTGYECEGNTTYVLNQTCPNNDLLLIDLVVQYL